jgi:hypothetical protein
MRVPVHWATRYLHVVIATDDEAITVEDRRTFAGALPIGRRRVRVPYAELREARIKNVARSTCLLVSIAAVATIVLTSFPFLIDLALGAIAALFLLMTFIRGIELTRDDGHSWTFPICRTHEFDASLAVMEAMQQREFAHPEPERTVRS